VLTPDGSRAYALDLIDDSVNVIDVLSDTRIATIALPACIPTCLPTAIAIGNNGVQVYVAIGAALNSIVVIDTNSNTLATQLNPGTTPLSLTASPISTQVYFGWAAGLASFDTNCGCSGTGALLKTYEVPGLALSPDESRLYFLAQSTEGGSGFLMTFDLTTSSITNSLLIGNNPSGIAVSQDGKKVYVSFPLGPFGGNIIAVDTLTNQVIGSALAPGAATIAVSPDNAKVYVSVNTGPYVTAFNATDLGSPSMGITGLLGIATDLAFVSREIFTYEAEAPGNVLSGKAQVVSCADCSAGFAVSGIGEPGAGPTGSALTFNGLTAVGTYPAKLSIYYRNASTRPSIPISIIGNGTTSIVNLAPAFTGSSVDITIPGDNISTLTFTGVQGSPSSSITIDRITIQ